MSKGKGWSWSRVPSKSFRPFVKAKKLKLEHVGLYAMLAERGGKNGKVWGNRKEMAEENGISVRTLYRYLDALEAVGALTREDHYKDRWGNQVQLIVLTSVEDFDRGVVSPVTRPVRQQGHEGRVTSGTLKESTSKENPETDSAPFGAVDGNPLGESEGEEESEPGIQGEKVVRGGEAYVVGFQGAAVTPIEPAEDNRETPADARSAKTTKTKKAGSSKKAIHNPEVASVYDAWLHEMRAKNPDHPELKIEPAEAAIIAKMLKKAKKDVVVSVIQLAVWDWLAIQERIQPWYSATRSPDIKTISYLLNHLAPFLGRGVSSSQHRVSQYHERFVSKTPLKSSVDESGLSLAERARRAYYADRG